MFDIELRISRSRQLVFRSGDDDGTVSCLFAVAWASCWVAMAVAGGCGRRGASGGAEAGGEGHLGEGELWSDGSRGND